MRAVRCLPAARAGFAEAGIDGPDGLRMTYAVKECFLTLQGEGVQSGSRAVFLRFAGLQSVVRARAGPGERAVQVLRHGLRRHRRRGWRQVRERRSAGGSCRGDCGARGASSGWW